MAVPKRKMSRANTRTRRSAWKADLTELNTIKVGGREVRVPRRLAKAYKSGLLDVEDWFLRSQVFVGSGTNRYRTPHCCFRFSVLRLTHVERTYP